MVPTRDAIGDVADAAKVAVSFEPEVEQVLGHLRTSIAATLAEIGSFSKPAAIDKALRLDRTLSRQLFHLASTAEPLSNGGMIPSMTSLKRFLSAAKSKGVSASTIQGVRQAYQVFEKLVEEHAGDRTTFNSMVSAANGVDDDWLATDLQHRRNAFRAMSHALGTQAKAWLQTFIINGTLGRSAYDVVALGGFVGLRVLRAMPGVCVFGTVCEAMQSSSSKSTCTPLGLSEAGGGYVLEPYSSSPLPTFVTRDTSSEAGLAREIFVEKPLTGNAGASTLMFGSLFRGLPVVGEPLRLYATQSQPTETLLLDCLLAPGLRGRLMPKGRAVMGFRDRYGSSPVALPGNFQVSYLGAGAGALSTPEIPLYADMLGAVDGKVGWGLGAFDAFRIKVDFPLYKSTIRMEWPEE